MEKTMVRKERRKQAKELWKEENKEVSWVEFWRNELNTSKQLKDIEALKKVGYYVTD